MIIDPATLSPAAMYRFMIGVIVPRPIAFISTLGAGGRFNLAPFSYFCGLTNVPPLLGVSINRRQGSPKDTLHNIRLSGDFVVNIVTEAMAPGMVQTSGDWPADVDEFEVAGFHPLPSDLVRAPRVAESPIHLECRLHREIELGQTMFVVGEIVRAHAAEEVLTEGRVDIAKLKPIGRLGGDGYTFVGQDLTLPRPRVEGGSGGGGG
jgi:flavin reductase (DIM6/NTAB) family NADH-FMN oxidoreductase RutF